MTGKKELESVDLMLPMLPEESQPDPALEDRAFDLVSKASALAGQVHPIVRLAIGALVRSMNCYYSNLIEGHNTTPRDIDRALAQDFAAEPARRALQHEAVAHIEVQKAIDESTDEPSDPASLVYITWLHREFCSRLPEELLWVEDLGGKRRVRVHPGELRDGEVTVGRHLPPSATALPAFLARFEQAYNPAGMSKMRRIVAIAAAHHRFAWIHPFYDGNGRVVRLMSHAMLKRLGVGSSLWSVSRGLARSVAQYKAQLMSADETRKNDLDGRGSLSQAALTEFCRYFLDTCIDQVDYMASVLAPSELLRRIEIYVEDEIRAGRLSKGAFPLLREALLAGEFERGQAPALTGYRERMGRTVLSDLLGRGLLVSETPKGAVRLGFPLDIVERWFPRLYPGID